MLGEIPEISECMVYGKKESEDAHDKELIITAKIIPNYTKIEELHGKKFYQMMKIYKIIWDKVKENNKKLTSYKGRKENWNKERWIWKNNNNENKKIRRNK